MRGELGVLEVNFFFVPEEILYCFLISFLINFQIVYILPMYQSLQFRIWFKILCFHFKDILILFQILIFFVKLLLILSQLELSRTELPKCTPIFLMENCNHNTFLVLSILLLYIPAH